MKPSPFVILFFTVFLDLIGFGIVLPLLPNYARELGASPLLIGIVAGSYSLMQFFSAPVWGRISDKIGRRPVILISVLTSVISYLIFSQSHSILLLLLSRILAGIGSAN
ncbi:MAG: MFS transporter, partial [Candidatus Thermochlorobacter sp.]